MFGVFRETGCENTRGKLSEYIDGRLGADQTKRVEAHLKECQACRSELESLRSTVNLLRRLPLAAVPHSFALTEVESVRRPVALNILQGATAFAALALVVLLLSDLFSYYGEPALLQKEAAPASAPSLAETENRQLPSAEKASGAPAEERGYAPGGSPTPRSADEALQAPAVGVAQPAPQTPEVSAEGEPAPEEGAERTLPLSSWTRREILGPLRAVHLGLLGVIAALGGAMVFVGRRQRTKT